MILPSQDAVSCKDAGTSGSWRDQGTILPEVPSGDTAWWLHDWRHLSCWTTWYGFGGLWWFTVAVIGKKHRPRWRRNLWVRLHANQSPRLWCSSADMQALGCMALPVLLASRFRACARVWVHREAAFIAVLLIIVSRGHDRLWWTVLKQTVKLSQKHTVRGIRASQRFAPRSPQVLHQSPLRTLSSLWVRAPGQGWGWQ